MIITSKLFAMKLTDGSVTIMKKIRLIIVEDEPAILRGITNLIRGFDDVPIEICGTYTSAKNALEEIDSTNPKIIMTDVRMPVISGLDLIKVVRESGRECEYLIMSGYAEFEYARQAMKLDVSNYLLKPPRKTELKEALQAVCRKILLKEHDDFDKILRDIIFQDISTDGFSEEEKNSRYHISVFMLGVYTQDHYPGANFNAEKWRRRNVSKMLQEVIVGDWENIWILTGMYPNIKIIVSKVKRDIERQMYDVLLDRAKTDSITITFVKNDKQTVLKEIHSVVQDTILFLRYSMKMGKSQFLIILQNAIGRERHELLHTERNELYRLINEEQCSAFKALYMKLEEQWENEKYPEENFRDISKEIIGIVSNRIKEKYKADFYEDILKQIGEIETQSSSLKIYAEKVAEEIRDVFDSVKTNNENRNIKAVVDSIYDYIESNYSKDLDIEKIAQEKGYHPVYLISQFSKIKGISPVRLQINLRIENAQYLLKKTDMTVKEIGETVGYIDVSYFSRAFKERTGIRPGKYRNIR